MIKSMNPEQLDYLKLLKSNLSDNARWLALEIGEVGIPSEAQLKTLKQYAGDIARDAKSLEALVRRGEY